MAPSLAAEKVRPLEVRARTRDTRWLLARGIQLIQCPSAAGPGAKLVRTLTDNTVRRTYSAGTTPVIDKYSKMLGAPRLAPPTHKRPVHPPALHSLPPVSTHDPPGPARGVLY